MLDLVDGLDQLGDVQFDIECVGLIGVDGLTFVVGERGVEVAAGEFEFHG